MAVNAPRCFTEGNRNYSQHSRRTKQLEELSCSFHLPLLIMNTMINRHYSLIAQVCTIYLPSHLVQRTACRMPEQMQSPAIKQEMQSSEKTG